MPTLVVALHRNCPCPRQCASDLNRLARELAPAARVVGVVDTDRGGTLHAAKDSGLEFEMRSDPRGRLLARIGARYTLDLALVGRNGKVIGFWGGFDRKSVGGIVIALGKEAAKMRIVPESYPEVTQTGCALSPSKVPDKGSVKTVISVG